MQYTLETEYLLAHLNRFYKLGFLVFLVGQQPRLRKVWIETGSSFTGKGQPPMLKAYYLVTQFSGSSIFENVFGKPINLKITLFLSFIIFVFLIFAAMSLWKKKYIFRYLITAGAIFYGFILFYHGFGAWGKIHHYLLIYPLPQILLAYFLTDKKRLKKIVICVFIFNFAFANYDFYQMSQKTCGVKNYSCKIREVADKFFLTKKPIVAGDWGLATQLLLLTQGKQEINEIIFMTNTSDKSAVAPIIKKYQDQCANFIFYSPQYTMFLKEKAVMIPIIEKEKKYHKIIIKSRDGIPLYEVYMCRQYLK